MIHFFSKIISHAKENDIFLMLFHFVGLVKGAPSKIDLSPGTSKQADIWRICWAYDRMHVIKVSAFYHDV